MEKRLSFCRLNSFNAKVDEIVCHSAETIVTMAKGYENSLSFCRNNCHNGQMRSAPCKNASTASEAASTIRQTLEHEPSADFGTKSETKAA